MKDELSNINRSSSERFLFDKSYRISCSIEAHGNEEF